MTNNPEKVNSVLEELRQRIKSGEYGRSGRLPSRLQLAKEFNTSAETINKAVNVLRAEGLLVARGRAVAVSPPPVRVPGMMWMGCDAAFAQGFYQGRKLLLARGDGNWYVLTDQEFSEFIAEHLPQSLPSSACACWKQGFIFG